MTIDAEQQSVHERRVTRLGWAIVSFAAAAGMILVLMAYLHAIK